MRELARRIAGLSQQEAADLLGVTQPRISELVRENQFFLRLISWSTWRRGPVLM
jgi:predicted transcriptional regulator